MPQKYGNYTNLTGPILLPGKAFRHAGLISQRGETGIGNLTIYFSTGLRLPSIELLMKASRLLSGAQDGVFIVP